MGTILQSSFLSSLQIAWQYFCGTRYIYLNIFESGSTFYIKRTVLAKEKNALRNNWLFMFVNDNAIRDFSCILYTLQPWVTICSILIQNMWIHVKKQDCKIYNLITHYIQHTFKLSLRKKCKFHSIKNTLFKS